MKFQEIISRLTGFCTLSWGFNGTHPSHSARSHDASSPSWKIGGFYSRGFYLCPPRWSRPITACNRS